MATKIISVRMEVALAQKCNKVACGLGVNRNKLLTNIIEQVCDSMIEELEKCNGNEHTSNRSDV